MRIGDRPDVLSVDAAGEVAVVDAEDHQQGDDGPEGKLAERCCADAEPRERDELREGGGGVKTWWMTWQARGDQGANGLGLREFLLASPGRRGGPARRAVSASTDMGKKAADRDEAMNADGEPEEAVVEKDAADESRRPGEEQRVLLDDRPVAGDVVEQDEADGIEDAGPEVLERAGGGRRR